MCPRRATQQTLKHMAECNPTARPPRSIGEGMVPTGLANLRPAGSTSPRGIGKKFGKTASNRREMTAEMLLESCTNNDGYDLPSYNTELYLQYHMIPKITNLEPYTHLRVLYLEHNNLSRISGLSHLSHLRSLYLQNNQIQRIEGLDKLEMLDTLNLCVLPCANCSRGHLQPIAARRLGLVRVLPPFPLALPARALTQRPAPSSLTYSSSDHTRLAGPTTASRAWRDFPVSPTSARLCWPTTASRTSKAILLTLSTVPPSPCLT